MLMNQSIIVNEREYISAIRAAKKIGYTGDYVGQLCRAKKITGKLVGKAWYVDYNTLVEHKKNRKRGRAPVSRSQATARQKTPFPIKKIEKEILEKPASPVAELRPRVGVPVPKSLSNIEIVYEKEERPRLPGLKKDTSEEVVRVAKLNLRQTYAPLALSLLLLASVSLAKPELLSLAPIKNSYEKVALIFSDSREPAFVSFAIEWLKNIFDKKSTKTNELAGTFSENKNGIVVFPESEDRIGISNRIKAIFSDNVEVNFDEEGDMGVIVPVFNEVDNSENYAFVLVPINNQTSPSNNQ